MLHRICINNSLLVVSLLVKTKEYNYKPVMLINLYIDSLFLSYFSSLCLFRLCNDLQQLIQERADIEKGYAKSLRAWSKKWGELIEKGKKKRQ